MASLQGLAFEAMTERNSAWPVWPGFTMNPAGLAGLGRLGHDTLVGGLLIIRPLRWNTRQGIADSLSVIRVQRRP